MVNEAKHHSFITSPSYTNKSEASYTTKKIEQNPNQLYSTTNDRDIHE